MPQTRGTRLNVAVNEKTGIRSTKRKASDVIQPDAKTKRRAALGEITNVSVITRTVII